MKCNDTPLVFENVKTNCACLWTDVGMPDLGDKTDLKKSKSCQSKYICRKITYIRRLERVLFGYVDVQLKTTAFIRAVGWAAYFARQMGERFIDQVQANASLCHLQLSNRILNAEFIDLDFIWHFLLIFEKLRALKSIQIWCVLCVQNFGPNTSALVMTSLNSRCIRW